MTEWLYSVWLIGVYPKPENCPKKDSSQLCPIQNRDILPLKNPIDLKNKLVKYQSKSNAVLEMKICKNVIAILNS